VSEISALQKPGLIGQPGGWKDSRTPVFAPVESGASQQALDRRKVLVVEDDYFVASEVEMALLDAGFEVTGLAATADEAIELAKSHRPDLVVMDIRLAGFRDGVDAALELFRESGIRCIFATAHYEAATRQRAEPALPLGWLAKPYQPDTLLRAVHRALAELHKP
jgi:DNA-binding NarL/FixJ family response regulator